VLEALGESSCAPRLRSLPESDQHIQHFLELHRDKCKSHSWLAHTKNSVEARRCLPTRARVIVDTPDFNMWRLAVTDEDGDADDPPVIVANDNSYIWCNTPRVSYLLTRLACEVFCAGHTRIRFNRGESSWFPNAPVRFTDPAVTILEIAEGCFYTNSSLLMRSVKTYADFVRDRIAHPSKDDAMPLSVLLPPQSFVKLEVDVKGRGSRRKMKDMFERSLTRGFSLLFEGYPMSTAFGEVNDAPVWLLHQGFNATHTIGASCEAGHETAVREFLAELSR